MVNFMHLPRELREMIYEYYLLGAVESRRIQKHPNLLRFLTGQLQRTPAPSRRQFGDLPCLEVSLGKKQNNWFWNTSSSRRKFNFAAQGLAILSLDKETRQEAIYILATRFCFRLDEGRMKTQIRFLTSASRALLNQIRYIAVPAWQSHHLCPCCGTYQPNWDEDVWSDEKQRRCFLDIRSKLPSLRRVYVPKLLHWTSPNGSRVAMEHWPNQLLAFKDVKRVEAVPWFSEDSPAPFEMLNETLQAKLRALGDSYSVEAESPLPWDLCSTHWKNRTNVNLFRDRVETF